MSPAGENRTRFEIELLVPCPGSEMCVVNAQTEWQKKKSNNKVSSEQNF
jgi:hypothetical protein